MFARLNCEKESSFCIDRNITSTPDFVLIPGPGVQFDGKKLKTRRGEGIVLYLNSILSTFDFQCFPFRNYGRSKRWI